MAAAKRVTRRVTAGACLKGSPGTPAPGYEKRGVVGGLHHRYSTLAWSLTWLARRPSRASTRGGRRIRPMRQGRFGWTTLRLVKCGSTARP